MVALNILKAVGLLSLASVTFAGVVPKSGLVARSCDPEPPLMRASEDPKAQLVNNATSLFAWQLTGIYQYVGSDSSSLANIVDNPQLVGKKLGELVDHVNALGANGEIVNDMIFGRSGCPDLDLAHVLKYARVVFQTELNTIFADRSKGFTVLCDNWDHSRLQTIYQATNADALYNWVCVGSSAGKPTKQITSSAVPDAVTDDFVSSITGIFISELLGSLMNSEVVKTTCTKDWDAFSARLQRAGMKPSAAQTQFCTSVNQKSLPNVDAIKAQIKFFGTHLLIVQLFSLSGEEEYKKFLCNTNNYKLRNIDILGLDSSAFSSKFQGHCA